MARVKNELRVAFHYLPVEHIMIGQNDHAISPAKLLRGEVNKGHSGINSTWLDIGVDRTDFGTESNKLVGYH